ncbi:MAG TPA: phosphoenolpyruvate synthase [Dehalococcoidia bacterium]|nr:phosphoenolpyruvate synthase [Dehalococcoidia bacterium]
MTDETKLVAWFEEVGKNDIPLVGGKGANLGELTNNGIAVPPGFIVTSEAYIKFLKSSKLSDTIRLHLSNLDINDSKKLQDVASIIKNKFTEFPMPAKLITQIKQAYRKLGGGMVAVRSSATAEDLPDASFAGQQRTFLNVRGEDEVITAVKSCWASLFEPRAIFYRHEQGFDFQVGIAVPVQKMVQSEISGVLFTVEPLSNDQSKILMEAIYGLGEFIVSGEVTPDQYLVNKENLQIIEKTIRKQEWQLLRNEAAESGTIELTRRVRVSPKEQKKQKLSDSSIVALAELAKKIESLYKFPQDIEWAQQNGKFYILQTRPITTLKEREPDLAIPEIKALPMLTGVAASPGIAVGKVKLVPDPSDISKVEAGDVLVAAMTTPDYVPAMKRAVAIVTDRGGRTAHAAIVSRELGIPCVVGTDSATSSLKDGQIITVDGYRGRVFNGKVAENRQSAPNIVSGSRIKTKTKVYVNLAEPELAEAVAAKNVDGVGLLRAEFMVAQIGGHPRYMLHEGKERLFEDSLAHNITSIVKAFHPRPVVYRTTDFKTNEYRNLQGGDRYEENEENPMIGYRGCSRYTREIEVLRMELNAMKKVCQHYDNLWIMIPFVRFVSEMERIKNIFISEGLYQFPNFKLWMMVEVPSNIFLIDKFLDTGIDGISIGSNDLTQLILGIDRDNAKLAPQFDERNEAVQIAIEKAVKTTIGKGKTCSICGQAPSSYPEITNNLVKWGITSVSVSPDMIERTRDIIAKAEAKLS